MARPGRAQRLLTAMRELSAQGETQRAIAVFLNVSQSTVSRVLLGQEAERAVREWIKHPHLKPREPDDPGTANLGMDPEIENAAAIEREARAAALRVERRGVTDEEAWFLRW